MRVSTSSWFRSLLHAAALAVVLAGCAPTAPLTTPPASTTVADGARRVTILQLNDVYEITPVEGGRSGGLARVATLRQRLLAEGAPVITVLAGDYLSPSALGTARVDLAGTGQPARLAGRQMVATLNAMGLDVAALGNHEFDVSEADFRARMQESRFAVVSANVRAADGAAPFPAVVPRTVRRVAVAPGDTLRVGVTSVVLPSTVKPYVVYTDPLPTLAAEAARLDAEADVEIALTHLAFADDATAAATIPGLDLVLGGHEHDNVFARRGPRWVPVAKADANARTVWVHRLTVGRDGAVTTESELVFVTDAIPDDPATAAVAAEWTERGFAGFRADGFEPTRRVTTTTEALDGREATVRNRPARLGALVAEAYRVAAGGDAAGIAGAVFNSGSIRIDDEIAPGPFTEYDAIRVLPFGGEVVTVRLPGALLARVLDVGVANAGSGGFLQLAGFEATTAGWTLGGTRLDPAALYTVATSDFLVSGLETGLDFLNAATNPDVVIVGRHGDVRRALVAEMARVYGAP